MTMLKWVLPSNLSGRVVSDAEHIANPPPFDWADVPASNWWAHGDLVQEIFRARQPAVVVEIGVFRGSSLYLMAEIALRNNIRCGFLGVDTWGGDIVWNPGTVEMSDAEEQAKRLVSGYGNVLLLKDTGWRASLAFPRRSVDLVHIDADHSYEGVKRDFENWLPKLAPEGIMLLHDIGVIQKDVGVRFFWREVQSRFPTFSDTRAVGLGVVAPFGVPAGLPWIRKTITAT